MIKRKVTITDAYVILENYNDQDGTTTLVHKIPRDAAERKKYLGDYVGTVVGKIRNASPCWWCNKIEAGLNALDKGARKLIRA